MERDRKQTILLVDADHSVTSILSTRLTNVGFNVLIADTDELALKLIEAAKPDIILLDILMKSEDGKDILSYIKTNISSFNIPTIILSSDIDVNSVVYGFLSGANDYIVKPFRFPEVLARINTQLRIINMQKELEEKNRELVEKNILLQKMATTDSLTGLYNKGYILNRLNSELLRSARYLEPISFIMLDVDFFKKINDTYGHLTGDEVLKEVANQIKISTRDVDISARYGGEEFLIVCPRTDIFGAQIVAERIRLNIENALFKLDNIQFAVTASLGISSIKPELPINTQESALKMIENADTALYRAKSNGRNRTEIYDTSLDLGEIDESANTHDEAKQAPDEYAH